MILIHTFLSQKSVDELVAALLMLAERRKLRYARIQAVRAATTGIDEPIIHPRASVTVIPGGITEVTFFRADAPDDETPGTVNRWQYLDENGEPENGKVIEVTLEHDPIGTVVTFVCCDEGYLTEFRRLLANFGETLPEPTERDQETQVDAPTGETPDDDSGKEVQATIPTGDAPRDDAGKEVQAAAQAGDAPSESVNQVTPRAAREPNEKLRIKARLALYVWKGGGKIPGKSIANQEDACAALDISDRTFRYYRKHNLLFSDREIEGMNSSLEELLKIETSHQHNNS